jgi:putative oxidoreductase
MAVQSTDPTYAASPSAPAAGLDGFAARSSAGLLLAARVALGAIFVISGAMKLGTVAAFSASLAARGVPASWLWGPVGATVEFVGGVLIVLGLGTRYAAVLMILFVIVATAISHRFWEYADPQQFRLQQSQFFKNLAIIGGFIGVLAAGGGRFALDMLWRRRA